MYKDTLQKVKRFMTETGMLQNCSEIILGVSGGPDSMTMLHILNELRDEFGYRLRVVHVNHGIRGKEALRDQQMVEKICSEWKIPCAVYNYDAVSYTHLPHCIRSFSSSPSSSFSRARTSASPP